MLRDILSEVTLVCLTLPTFAVHLSLLDIVIIYTTLFSSVLGLEIEYPCLLGLCVRYCISVEDTEPTVEWVYGT